MRQLVFVPATLALALQFAACDLKPRSTANVARDTWSASEPQLRQLIVTLHDRQTSFASRMNELRTAVVDNATLAARITALQDQLAAIEPAIANVESTFAQATADIDAAISTKNKVEARRVVETGLAAVTTAIDTAKAALDAPEPQLAMTSEALSRDLANLALEKQRLRQIAIEGGTLRLTDLAFKPEGELDTSTGPQRAALDRALTLATACDELQFTIVGHTSRMTDPDRHKRVSAQRADAVAKFLVRSGIPATKIEKVEGLGSTRLTVAEPAPGSAAAESLSSADLAALQRQNDRVELVVTKPCPTDGTNPAANTATPPQPSPGVPTPTRVEPGHPAPIRAEVLHPNSH